MAALGRLKICKGGGQKTNPDFSKNEVFKTVVSIDKIILSASPRQAASISAVIMFFLSYHPFKYILP